MTRQRILRTESHSRTPFSLFVVVLAALIVLTAPALGQNPVPFVDQPLVPDATAPGGTAFTLTLNGAGFVATSVVNWNGSPRATTFVSSSKLTAAILASDIAKGSTAAVTVVSPSPGGGVSNTLFFSIAAVGASLSFLPAVTYLTGGGNPYSVAIADVNADGTLDLVVANGNGGAAGTVGVLLGNGNGTFKPVHLYGSGGNQAASVAVADVNGDGKPDVIVTDTNNSTNIGVLLGNGDGTFRRVVTYSSGGGSPWSVAVADVNGDGKLDLLVANECAVNSVSCSEGLVGVLLGNGDGTFRPAVMYSSGGPNFYNPVSLSVADLNGDGKLDLVVTNACGTSSDCSENGSVGVLLGNGDGTFNPAMTFGTGGQGTDSVAVADVNGDGKPDLVVANLCSSSGSSCSYAEPGDVGVLLGNGDGTFQPVVVYGSGAYGIESATIADLNGDGEPDVVAANLCSSTGSSCPFSETGNVGVLLGNGSGTLQSAQTYGSGNIGADFIVAADVNGDGQPDLLVVNLGSSVGVLLNNSSPCVNKCPTSTMLLSSLNPSIYGQSVTWTATVTTSGSVPPTGTVNFEWGGGLYSFGTAKLNASGVATLTKALENADSYAMTAVYMGDVNNMGSTSVVLNQVITQATSSATLTSSPNPSTEGESVTFTATISSPTVTPTGPVAFTAGKTVLGTAQLSDAKAKFTTSTLAVGSTTVTATYYGDSNISESAASVTQTVQQ
jgi:hypothetical protein